MRYFLIAGAGIALSAATPATAESPSINSHTQSTALKWEIAYLTLSAIDTAQTIDCLNRNICAEGNPLFGKHPSAAKLILAKAGLGLLHFAAFERINRHNPRGALRVAQISCGVQGAVVGLNARFSF